METDWEQANINSHADAMSNAVNGAISANGVASRANAARWRRASKCDNSSGNCVEVAMIGNATAVRDSKDADGPVLVYTRSEWATFVEGVKNNEFDS